MHTISRNIYQGQVIARNVFLQRSTARNESGEVARMASYWGWVTGLGSTGVGWMNNKIKAWWSTASQTSGIPAKLKLLAPVIGLAGVAGTLFVTKQLWSPQPTMYQPIWLDMEKRAQEYAHWREADNVVQHEAELERGYGFELDHMDPDDPDNEITLNSLWKATGWIFARKGIPTSMEDEEVFNSIPEKLKKKSIELYEEKDFDTLFALFEHSTKHLQKPIFEDDNESIEEDDKDEDEDEEGESE